MSRQSRLEELSKKRSERNIALILLGIIIIITIFFFFGGPLLINLSLFMANSKNNDTTTTSNNSGEFITAPILNDLPDATGSAKLNISGSAASGQKIKLYINNKLTDETQTSKKNDFSFNNVSLNIGDNLIQVKSVTDDKKESELSRSVHIFYKNQPPKLEIKSPQDGQSFSGNSQLKIEGSTDPGVRITINDYWAIVDNKGNFSYLFNMQKGENKIKISAADDANNQTTKEIKITLNQ